MKQRRLFILLLLGTVILQAGASAGCDQIKSAADTAKNTVTSMVDKVNTFEKDQEANALNSAVKEFYNGVVSGSINATTRGDRITASLPDQDAAQEERTNAAKNLTILSVNIKTRLPTKNLLLFPLATKHRFQLLSNETLRHFRHECRKGRYTTWYYVKSAELFMTNTSVFARNAEHPVSPILIRKRFPL